jgi:L-threonylcarbamoyladenylate synthase
MEIISNCTQNDLEKAAKALKDGHLVAFPTETVYGLGADAINEKAVTRLYSVKGRPIDHPVIVHISSINQLDKWAVDIPDSAFKLAKDFWPGPMTLILNRTKLAKDFVTGGQSFVGLRVPDHPIAKELLIKFEALGGTGVVAPSANRFGAVSPTTAQDVITELEEYLTLSDKILDGNQCEIGLESTVIRFTNNQPQILRPGAVTHEMIEESVGLKIMSTTSTHKIKAPGMLLSHYAPKAKVVVSGEVKQGDGFIAMSDICTPTGAFRLLSPDSVEEFAKDLYRAFRTADQKKLQRVVVIPPKGGGLAVSIVDRIRKASN